MVPDVTSAQISEERRERRSQESTRIHERNIRNSNREATLLDYDDIRIQTAQYLGYIGENELFAMSPREWQSWIKGAREKELDSLEHNLHLATANALAQNGKKLGKLQKQIEIARKKLYQNNDEFKADRKAEIERAKSIRARQIADAEKLFGKNM